MVAVAVIIIIMIAVTTKAFSHKLKDWENGLQRKYDPIKCEQYKF